MRARLRHLELALTLLPGLLVDRSRRALLAEMRAFCRALPQALEGPLAEALERLQKSGTVPRAGSASFGIRDASTVRRLADLAALLDRRSPLGLCLRRSLARYYFLRRAGLPVVLQFGARLRPGDAAVRDLRGHAWLTLAGRPYFEVEENWRGFTVMFCYPPPEPEATQGDL